MTGLRIQNIEGRELNMERPRKNPPSSTARNKRVKDRPTINLKKGVL